jgi:predicted phage terminase large subunit-like protein
VAVDFLTRAAEKAEAADSADYPTPGSLAVAIDPRTVQTPALDLLDSALVDAAEGTAPRLIFTMPPQEGKSVRVSSWFVLWLLKRNPDLRIGIVSYSDRIARRWGRAVRNHIAANPDLGIAVSPDSRAANEWTIAGHDGGLITIGIAGSINGRPLDVLIIDDPLKGQKEADSEYYRETCKEFWRSSGSARLSEGAIVVVITTRWHEDDLAGWLLAEDPGDWRYINIPALADHDPAKGETDPLGREPGEWMISARRRTVRGWLRRQKDAGVRAFTSLYQGRPSPGLGNVWLRTWWRRYSVPLWSQHPTIPGAWWIDPQEFDQLIMSWDMAFKDTKSSDYVVGQVWLRRGANAYLLDQVRKRLSFTDTLTAFTAMHERWPQAVAKLVEDKANGTAVIDTLKSKIPGIIPINPTESKYSRANAVSPLIQAGNVWLPDKTIALFDPEELIEEGAAFPRAAHDDQVDATSQALARLLLRVGAGQASLDAMKKRAEAKGIAVPTTARDWRKALETIRGKAGTPDGEAPQ